MKKLPLLVLLLILFAAGCGKPAEQKAMEEQLNAEVLAMHEKQMGQLNEIRDLVGGIDIELSNHDRLAATHPKEYAGKTPDDLVKAKNMLLGAKASMERWMAGYKMYDPQMNHEDAMAKLTKDKDDITAVQNSLDSAKAAAHSALDAERTFAERFAVKSGGQHKSKQ